MTLFSPSRIHLILPVAAAVLLIGQARGAVAVLDVMQHELDRSVEVLSEQPTPLYFLSYEITEERITFLGSSFGTASGTSRSDRRALDIDLRVGDYSLDNTHPVRDRRGFGGGRSSRLEVPVSDVDGLRSALWLQTDKRYKQAIEQLTKVKTDVQVKVEEEDQAGDFSAESPERFLGDPVSLAIDESAWRERLKRYTAPFSASAHIYSANAGLAATVVTRWYVNSEGSRLRTTETRVGLSISASTKADDGMVLPRFETYFAFTPEGLPDEDAVLAEVNAMVRDLEALRVAPLAEPYTGPAILSGRASGVFFHEILGHRVEGHRHKSQDDSQTFKAMLGEAVLPKTFSVVFDPTVRRAASTDLAGAYRFDNQGVRGRRVAVIEDGVLKRFLMSRTPIDGFPRSNGHGRKQVGFAPVSRQSNLFVEVSESHAQEDLKEMLIDRMREAGKPYGLLFDDVRGGFTQTGRFTPNAFNVQPIMVYRIYADGREELVRGVDLIGTPLTTFSRVAAAGGDLAVFNGTCGAESGGVPVSAVAPAILVEQIEVQKKGKSQDRLPLLPPPPLALHPQLAGGLQ